MTASDAIGIVLVIAMFLLLFVVFPYSVQRSANERGTDHHWAYGLMMFFSILAGPGFIIFGIFYLSIRDDIGEIDDD